MPGTPVFISYWREPVIQVLTNARERQLYDLSIDPRTGRVARKAAGGDSQGNAEKRWDTLAASPLFLIPIDQVGWQL